MDQRELLDPAEAQRTRRLKVAPMGKRPLSAVAIPLRTATRTMSLIYTYLNELAIRRTM